MLFPLPLGGVGLAAVPEEIKRAQAKWWWCLALAFILVCVARVVSLDIFGALISGMMGFLVYYMLKEECKNMPRFLAMFGMLCAFNAFFEILPLMQAFGGRVSRKVEPGVSTADSSKQTFSVVVETHPFFDPKMDWVYNLQSAAMILSPITFIFGAILAHKAFRILESNMDGNIDPFGTAGGPAGAGSISGFGSTANAAQARPGHNPSGGFKEFSGQGHRLGGN